MNPRNHGSHFEKHKAAFEEGAGRDDAMMEDVEETSSPISPIEKEKAEVIYKAWAWWHGLSYILETSVQQHIKDYTNLLQDIRQTSLQSLKSIKYSSRSWHFVQITLPTETLLDLAQVFH